MFCASLQLEVFTMEALHHRASLAMRGSHLGGGGSCRSSIPMLQRLLVQKAVLNFPLRLQGHSLRSYLFAY